MQHNIALTVGSKHYCLQDLPSAHHTSPTVSNFRDSSTKHNRILILVKDRELEPDDLDLKPMEGREQCVPDSTVHMKRTYLLLSVAVQIEVVLNRT